MAQITRQQKKEYAKLLFLRENMTQKEIAAKTQVTEKTIGKWIKEGNWMQLKASVIITKEEALKRTYRQINEIHNAIEKKEAGQQFATGKEADSLAKLAAAARSMETDVSVSDTVEVFKRFINWLRSVDIEKAKEIVELQDKYIKTLLNE